MRVSPLFSRICPLLSRWRLSSPGRRSFRPWLSLLRSLVRSFGTADSPPILPEPESDALALSGHGPDQSEKRASLGHTTRVASTPFSPRNPTHDGLRFISI